jgi:hypothetical protein
MASVERDLAAKVLHLCFACRRGDSRLCRGEEPDRGLRVADIPLGCGGGKKAARLGFELRE